MSALDLLNAGLEVLQTRLTRPEVWLQLGVIVLAGAIAWLIDRRWSGYLKVWLGEDRQRTLSDMTLRGIKRIVFPLTMLLLVLLGRALLQPYADQTQLLDIVIPLLLALAGIRMLVYTLRRFFAPGPALRALETTISITIWSVYALYLLGWLPAIADTLNSIGIGLGKSRLTLLMLLKGGVSLLVFLILSYWLATFLEHRVMRLPYLSAGMRLGIAKVTKFLLLALGILVGLNAVGIDLTALTVFGGALGVGLGLGLQRIASNFVSGFILLFDRSIRPGDVISIGNSFGWIQEMQARYVVVRDRDGVDTLIPNENLITSQVINWSYLDRNVRIKAPVQISYRDDPEQAMQLMVDAARENPRVLADPPPVARLMGFGDNGINLELRFWVSDPEEGVNNVRSEINLAIWRGFKTLGITIPYPQRDVYLKEPKRGD
ncbi:MAG: mechanosensitive ion channel [Gammaproteobacteria bacterium]|jgi:small-conductance mechanosensitive channel